jgi:SAM-dependent methyltransferase
MKIFGIDIGEKKAKGSGSCCGPECCSEPTAATTGVETARSQAMKGNTGAIGGQSPDAIKAMVKEKYGALAAAGEPGSSCCGAISTASGETACFSEGYSGLQGYEPAADLGLGCGLPTESADIKPGDTVLDLGSGAGNDAFVARSLVGESGRVIGVDMTEAMIGKAENNRAKLGHANVEFRLGEIEALPVADDSVNVVISNCVLNLVPDKAKAYAEVYRVLKPGGHFSISDIVLSGPLPERMRTVAALYAGCVAGAMIKSEYLFAVLGAGFKDIRIDKEREIVIPDAVLAEHLGPEEIRVLRLSGTKILSITVRASKG